MKYYIAYGSNLNKEQMAYRCPNARPVGTFKLKGYQLVFRGNSHTGVANVEKRPGASTPVALWRISEADEKSLDRYEGFPRLYTKVLIPLQIGDEYADGMMYVMTGAPLPQLPSSYYFGVIEQGYRDFKLESSLLHAGLKRTKEMMK